MKSWEKIDKLLDVSTEIINETEISNIDKINNDSKIKVSSDSISIEEVKNDFLIARETLFNSVQMGKNILDKIYASFDLYDNDAMDPELISSISNLIKTISQNLKILTDSYKTIISIEQSIKGNNQKNKNSDISINNMNIVVSKSTNDVISEIDKIINSKE